MSKTNKQRRPLEKSSTFKVQVFEEDPVVTTAPKSWNNPTMKLIFVGVVALALIGCGKSETATIGEPGEKGTYQRQIDTSKDVAGEATAKVKQDNKEWESK